MPTPQLSRYSVCNFCMSRTVLTRRLKNWGAARNLLFGCRVTLRSSTRQSRAPRRPLRRRAELLSARQYLLLSTRVIGPRDQKMSLVIAPNRHCSMILGRSCLTMRSRASMRASWLVSKGHCYTQGLQIDHSCRRSDRLWQVV
jgi:hypothetical protein